MDSLPAAKIKRTLLVGVAAKSDYVIKALTSELIKALGAVSGDIDSDFPQYLSGPGIDKGGLGAGRKGFDPVSQEMIGNSFRHLGAAGIGSAKKKDPFFIHILLKYPHTRIISEKKLCTAFVPAEFIEFCPIGYRSFCKRKAFTKSVQQLLLKYIPIVQQ